ncbi:Alpha/Beta hydrolase protein [Pelagophyceae sp. CCMP2097]|nr:Alpha/Beta hydrolase protein [Pelagophyceae sp. CCMP2097]|mmetsp:Transcript_9700/g.31962  ORF Transcript_9700/g.31962 Transcript_9700/m.31962 type:complete len:361 (+) Transcript_9700:126-1208(+)
MMYREHSGARMTSATSPGPGAAAPVGAAGATKDLRAIPIWRHPHMCLLDKVVNWLGAVFLRMHKLDASNVASYRAMMHKADGPGYKRAVDKAGWTVAKEVLPSGAEIFVHTSPTADGPVPLVLYVHGGGFVIGEARDAVGSALLSDLGEEYERPLAWASVEYRLAPEHPFPAAADDCAAAVELLAGRKEYSSLSIVGVSAGANLAIVTAAAAVRRGISVAALVAICPFVDPTAISDSYRTNAHQGIAPLPFLATCWRFYVGDEDARSAALKDWRVCPQTAEDAWRGPDGKPAAPPRAIIWTDLADSLCDEGAAVAKSLEKAGAKVLHLEAKATHCFGLHVDTAKKKTLLSEWAAILAASG